MLVAICCRSIWLVYLDFLFYDLLGSYPSWFHFKEAVKPLEQNCSAASAKLS